MGDAADDARDTEELWDELKWYHNNGFCNGFEDECPYCNSDFVPLFEFQVNHGEE